MNENLSGDTMMVATDSFVVEIDGVPRAFAQGEGRIRLADAERHGIAHLFRPLEATYPDIEAATAAPGEQRGDDAPRRGRPPKNRDEVIESASAAPGERRW